MEKRQPAGWSKSVRCDSGDNKEVAGRQRRMRRGANQCNLHLRTGTRTIRIVVEFATCLVVDDAVTRIVRSGTQLEGASLQCYA